MNTDSHAQSQPHRSSSSLKGARAAYSDAYFGLGHSIRLTDAPGVFRVSQAGLSLGYYLVRNVSKRELSGRILDLGTGSGAQALLLRSLGASQITATDVCDVAVGAARENELLNFGNSQIEYAVGDLFGGLSRRGAPPSEYDLIVFNPPGWREPSTALKSQLAQRKSGLDLSAMFYGDSVVLRFLDEVSEHLSDDGRVIIGLNSLMGISDVLRRHQESRGDGATGGLKFRLLERVEIPLLFYTDAWEEVRTHLLDEFERWRLHFNSAFVRKGDEFHWFYEIVEITKDR